MDNLITVEKVSEILGNSVTTLNRWRSTAKKDLPYIKVGGRVMYSQDDVQKWIEKNRVS